MTHSDRTVRAAVCTVREAVDDDAGELLTLQRAAFLTEAQRYGDPMLPPLRDSLEQVRDAIAAPSTVVLVAESIGTTARPGRLLGAARLHLPGDGQPGEVGRVAVAPDLQRAGIGSQLMRALHEVAARAGVARTDLFTGGSSASTIAFYRRLGYVEVDRRVDDRGVALQVMSRTV